MTLLLVQPTLSSGPHIEVLDAAHSTSKRMTDFLLDDYAVHHENASVAHVHLYREVCKLRTFIMAT